jgi:hypothetical protein
VKRKAKNLVPLTIINDSCLAFSVLVHNDGQKGNLNYRVLELSKGLITPTIVMLDAHKHLGADKGISMTMGTEGTLSHLSGHVRVGAAPCRGELIRAIADLSLVGVDGYYEKYHGVVAAIDGVLKSLQANGMKLMNRQHRAKGSTVFAFEDPSAVMQVELKKKGHGMAPIYLMEPSQTDRCQTGFQFSLTPHCMREFKDGKSALDIFAEDALAANKNARSRQTGLVTKFAENSLFATLLSGGNTDNWLLAQLRKPGFLREVVSLLLRRLYSGILDSGCACSDKHPAPLAEVGRRMSIFAALQSLALVCFMRRFKNRANLQSLLQVMLLFFLFRQSSRPAKV